MSAYPIMASVDRLQPVQQVAGRMRPVPRKARGGRARVGQQIRRIVQIEAATRLNLAADGRPPRPRHESQEPAEKIASGREVDEFAVGGDGGRLEELGSLLDAGAKAERHPIGRPGDFGKQHAEGRPGGSGRSGGSLGGGVGGLGHVGSGDVGNYAPKCAMPTGRRRFPAGRPRRR